MSDAPVEMRPWRESPFIRGKCYRVRRSFSSLRDSFTAGEVLTFESHAWSRYDGITGYCFRQPGRDTLRVWDIDDETDILVWRELFEEVCDPATRDAGIPVNDLLLNQPRLYDAAVRLGE